VFVLVRHAHAGSKRRWSGPDEERPLSPRGLSQAREIARLLRDVGVTRLLSSPTVRCRQTLVPASEELWVPIEPVDALGADASGEALLDLLSSPGVNGAALSTHGETLETLAKAWRSSLPAEAVAAVPDLSATPKGGSWLVEHYDGVRVVAHLLAKGAG
jgi:phosphohistidine phosphatase SixA